MMRADFGSFISCIMRASTAYGNLSHDARHSEPVLFADVGSMHRAGLPPHRAPELERQQIAADCGDVPQPLRPRGARALHAGKFR